MKSNQRPDKRFHIRKKVAGGTTGAVLGAVVGGPVGALLGGVIGTVVGNAAERGRLSNLAASSNGSARKPVLKAKRVMKRAVSKASKTGRGQRAKTRAKVSRSKSKAKR
ncbi:MAG TPA: hypothetical protein VNT99_15295 [Methylomirabilota bacterium]|nr:hypothetical protein [Methylomirabilota bacterium]